MYYDFYSVSFWFFVLGVFAWWYFCWNFGKVLANILPVRIKTIKKLLTKS